MKNTTKNFYELSKIITSKEYLELSQDTKKGIICAMAKYLKSFGVDAKIGFSNCLNYFSQSTANKRIAIFSINVFEYFTKENNIPITELLQDYQIYGNGYAKYFIFNEYENSLVFCDDEYLENEYFTDNMMEKISHTILENNILDKDIPILEGFGYFAFDGWLNYAGFWRC